MRRAQRRSTCRHTLSALGLAALCLSAPSAAQDLKDLARNAKTSVLLLRILDGSGRELGSGTGFYSSTDGLLVTNHHVVAPARRIEAVAADGVRLEVLGLVAEDEINDLAVLKIATDRTSPLRLAPRDTIDPGERVVVLGGPLGLAGSLSEGIVSAVRQAEELESHRPGAEPLLQITAARRY